MGISPTTARNHERLFPGHVSTLKVTDPELIEVFDNFAFAPETRFERGLALQREIFGKRIERMHRETPEDQAHLNRFLAAHCFGDHLTRTGLDLPTRELLTFAMLLSLRGCEAQLKGHIEGNLRVGNDRARLLDVLTQLLPYVGYPRTLNALRCLDEVAPPTRPAAPDPDPNRSQPGV